MCYDYKVLMIEYLQLKDLYTKKDEIKKKELLAAVEKSSRTYDEIMAFLKTEE